MIQRRLAWPLRKDDTQIREAFHIFYWMLGASALGRPRGRVRGGRTEEGSGWGTGIYLWQIHVDIWQNQYNILFKIKVVLASAAHILKLE